MSLILEALRKSEADRRRGTPPGLFSPDPLAHPPKRPTRPGWPLLLGVVIAAFGGWWVARDPTDSPPSSDAPAASGEPAPAAAAVDPALTGPGLIAGSVPGGGSKRSAPIAATSAPANAAADAGADATEPAPIPAAVAATSVADAAPTAPPATASPEPSTPAPGTATGWGGGWSQVPGGSKSAPELPPPYTAAAQPAPPLPEPYTASAQPAPARVERETVTAPTPAPPLPVVPPAPPLPVVPPAPPSTPPAHTPDPTHEAEPSLPRYWELDFSLRRELPALNLSMHVWNPDPARRFVIINGKRYVEGGDAIEGRVQLRAIRRDGVVLEYQGRRFLLPR